MDAHDLTPTTIDPRGEEHSSDRDSDRGEALAYLHECRRRVNEVAGDRLRELAELSKDLSDWVQETNRQLDLLATELDPTPHPADAGTTSGLGGGGETSAADAAHLVAMQMAVRGADREEVDRYLREVFEIEETSGILDRAFAG